MNTLSFFVILAFLWYGFVVYKKGIEYRFHEESLMDLIVLSGVCSWLFGRLAYVVANINVFSVNWLRVVLIGSYPGYHLAGVILGLFLSVWLVSMREEIDFFKGTDLLFLGFLAGAPFERLGRVLVGEVNVLMGLPVELFQALAFLPIFVLVWRMEGEYRTYAWYRNRQTEAKNGFLAGVGFIFLGILTLVLSWGWGLVFILIGGGWLYFRSGRGFHTIAVKLLRKRK